MTAASVVASAGADPYPGRPWATLSSDPPADVRPAPQPGIGPLALLPDAAVTGKSSSFPDLTGWVVDYADMFTDGEERSLADTLQVLSETTTHQVVLVTVVSLEGRDIGDYVKELGRLWQLGYNGAHNGVIILLAAKEHLVAFEVGDDLKQVLTETVTNAIIDNTIASQSNAGDPVAGVRQAVKYTALALDRYARGFPVTSIAPLVQRRADTAFRACPEDAVDQYERLAAPKVLVGSEFGCRWSNEPAADVEKIAEEARRLCKDDWGLECTLIKSSPAMPVDASSPPPIVSIVQCANPANPEVAIGACTAVLALEEETEATYGDALANRGLAYYYKGDPRSAIADWNEAIRRVPILMVSFDGDTRHIQAAEAVKTFADAGEAPPAPSDALHYHDQYLDTVADLNHRDYARAFNGLKRLALLGYDDAQTRLGMMYLDGEGVPRDPITANWWLYLAAENGDAAARVALGKNLAAGYGIARDDQAALKWFRMAAEKGYANANSNIAEIEARLNQSASPPSPLNIRVTAPKIIAVKANFDEPALRAIFSGDFAAHLDELATLTASSIHIPELDLDFEAPGPDGTPVTEHIVYRDIELTGIVKGVARSVSMRGLTLAFDESRSLDLGRITANTVDLASFAALYSHSDGKSSGVPRAIYKSAEGDGGVLKTPATRCDIRRFSMGEYKVGPLRGNIGDVQALIQQAATNPGSRGLLFRALTADAEYVGAIDARGFASDGFTCSGLDPNGQLYSYGVGKITMGAMTRGHVPPIEFEDIRLTAPGMAGRITLDRLVIKSIDFGPIIALLKTAGDDEPADDWISAHIVDLIPAFDGIELSGMNAESADEKAPAKWETTSLAGLALSLGNHIGGLPTTATISLSHLKTNNLIGSLEDAGIDATALAPFWNDDLDVSASISIKWDPAQQNAKAAISIDGIHLGTIDLTADFAGATLPIFSGKPFTSDDIRLKTARLGVKDAGMVLLTLRAFAAQAGKDVSVFQGAAKSWAEGAVFLALDASPGVQKLAASVSAFIGGGKSLAIEVKAKDEDGIALGALAPLLSGNPTALGKELVIQSGAK